jgi:hypothetical protein
MDMQQMDMFMEKMRTCALKGNTENILKSFIQQTTQQSNVQCAGAFAPFLSQHWLNQQTMANNHPQFPAAAGPPMCQQPAAAADNKMPFAANSSNLNKLIQEKLMAAFTTMGQNKNGGGVLTKPAVQTSAEARRYHSNPPAFKRLYITQALGMNRPINSRAFSGALKRGRVGGKAKAEKRKASSKEEPIDLSLNIPPINNKYVKQQQKQSSTRTVFHVHRKHWIKRKQCLEKLFTRRQ